MTPSPAIRAGSYPPVSGVTAPSGGPTTPVATPKTRPFLKVNPNFDPEKHLSADERRLRDGLYAWLDFYWKHSIIPLSKGLEPGWNGPPLIDGTMHLKMMRTVQNMTHSLLLLMDHWGDPKALADLQKLWAIVLSKVATSYGPKAIHRRNEQPGVMRFNYNRQDDGTPMSDSQVANYLYTDLHALDRDLSSGQVSQAKYAFKVNGCEEDYRRAKAYADDVTRRIAFLTKADHGDNAPWYLSGHTLRHPTESRFNFHFFEYLDSGDPKQKEAYEVFGKWLVDDFGFVDIDGVVVSNFPHAVQGRHKAKDMRPDKLSPSAQDVTYMGENVPHMLLAGKGGSPYHTPVQLAAVARVVHEVIMFEGPKGERVATSQAGFGPRSSKGKRVIDYKGKTYPAPWLQNRPDDVDLVLQITRGLATVTSVFATDRPEYLQNLKDMDSTATSEKYDRHGARFGQLFYGKRLEAM